MGKGHDLSRLTYRLVQFVDSNGRFICHSPQEVLCQRWSRCYTQLRKVFSAVAQMVINMSYQE